MPHLNQDPIFGQSLIYICEHNEEGTMGLIINKPFQDNQSSSILKDIGLKKIYNKHEVYFGGPVSPEKGFILHDCNYNKKETMLIENTAAVSYSDEIINDIKNGTGPNKFRLVMGYSGWDAGQLEKELENGDWMIMPSSEELIFSKSEQDKWTIAISNLDINFNNFSGQSGLA
tara:strand:- start:401 stop:919 length:519 start_codon:yes stop_codon:yes gene_type:complete